MYFLCKCICSLNIGHSNFKLCMAHRPLEVTGQCFIGQRVYFLVNELDEAVTNFAGAKVT